MAGDDKAFRERLNRFASPNDVAKSYRELEGKVSKGELKPPSTPFPKDGTLEQKAEWRTANGVPDKAEGYVEKLALPNGVLLGEADKPLVGGFAAYAMEKGWDQDRFNDAVSWYYEQQAVNETRRTENDGKLRVESEVALRGEWGQDFTANMNAVGAVRSMMPADVQEAVFAARTPDGRLLGNVPELNRFLAQLGRELNPAATIIPSGDGNAAQTIANELTSISETYRKAVGGDGAAHRAYYGHDGKPGLDARERELIDAQQKMSARGKAA